MLVQPVGHSRCLQEKDVPVDATEHIRDAFVAVDPVVVTRGSVTYDPSRVGFGEEFSKMFVWRDSSTLWEGIAVSCSRGY